MKRLITFSLLTIPKSRGWNFGLIPAWGQWLLWSNQVKEPTWLQHGCPQTTVWVVRCHQRYCWKTVLKTAKDTQHKQETRVVYEQYAFWWNFKRPCTGGARGKEPTCQWRRRKKCGFNLWVGKIPWRRKWQPIPVFLPGKFHGWRSLAGYSPWSHKASDMTKRLSLFI